MPMYSTHCTTCGKAEDRKLTFEAYEQVQQGDLALDCTCGGNAEVVFNPADVSFVLKDGQSGGFVSKAMKENAYRRRRRVDMGKRERDHVRPHSLQPNYKGQVMDTWKDAQDAAYQSTYDKVKEEHGAQVANDAAAKSASTYKERVRKEVS